MGTSQLPKAIPAAAATQIRNAREPSLIWVHSGKARVAVRGEDYPLSAGEALWVPVGMRYDIRTEEGTVAFPIFFPTSSTHRQVEAPTRVRLPGRWGQWLIYQFARSTGYLRGAGVADGLAGVVAGSPSSPPKPHPALPPEPTSQAAARVAARLLQDPADPAPLADLAASVNVSVRTLQQQFRAETGLAFAAWRTRVRVTAAATFIELGHSAGWAAHQAGFLTAAGLTKAFRQHVGMTPREYRALVPSVPPGQPAEPLAPGLPPTAGEAVAAAAPPPVPASKSWERINPFHVLIWAYRGTARVSIGERELALRQGEAAWLPAGVPNSVCLPQGAILLPLGSRDAARGTAAPPGEFIWKLSEGDEAFLLHTFVANYSLLRPPGHDAHFITRLFLEAANRAAPIPGVAKRPIPRMAAELFRRVRDNPADRRPLSAWAAELGIADNALAQEVKRAVNMPFHRWRSQLRMTLARQYLEEGMSVAQVARRLGYAHPASFAKVFRDQHQMSPRAYAQAGWRRTAEALIVP